MGTDIYVPQPHRDTGVCPYFRRFVLHREGKDVNPRTKILALTFGLVLPYIGLVVYFSLRIQDHPLPNWFPYFGLSYILATMMVLMFFSRRINRTARPEQEEQPKSVWLWLARAWMAYLVVVWSGFFLWGTYQTLDGAFEWQRSVPAGAFLLVFIALFASALYKDFRRRVKQPPPAGEKTTNKI